jgi:hypothetical protein
VSLRPSRRLWLAIGAGTAVLAIGGWLLWRALAVPEVERALAAATGHRCTVGGVWPGLRTLRVRDVVVFGAPPFQGAPLARLSEVDVHLGGPGGFWTPRSVVIRGLHLIYLRAGNADNVRGRPGQAPATPRPAVRAARPAIEIRDGRLEGYVRLGDGRALAVRSEDVSGVRDAGGDLRARAGKLVLELAGVATLAAPQVEVATAGDQRRFGAQQVRLIVPAGGVLLSDLVVEGELGAHRSRVNVQGAGAAGTPAFAATAVASGGGLRGSLQARDMALGPLRPLVRELGIHPDRARGRLSLQVDVEPGQPGRVAFDGEVSGLDLLHARLDRDAWRDLAASFRGLASVSTGQAMISVERAELTALGIPVQLQGSLALRPVLSGDLHLSTPPGHPPSCATLLSAQAAPVRQVLAGMQLDGQLGVTLSLVFDAAAWEELALDVKLSPRCRVTREPDLLEALLPRLRGGKRARRALGAARVVRPLPIDSEHPDYVSLSRMPPWLPAAFITAEDGRFFAHQGFDLENIRRALAHDFEVADFAKGASTITQQVAKNLFLGPERTLGRKLEELVLAWRLHDEVPKHRMLELYLNIIELGPGIRGVKRAAQVYFGKRVSDLSALEAAHLAALTPNPVGYARRFRDGRVDEGWLLKLYDLLGMMKRSGRLTDAELAAARNERLNLNRI